MARFRNRILPMVDRLYGIIGDKTTFGQIQVEQPIQPVHNVAREAEVGSGHPVDWNGYHVGQTITAAAGSGTYNAVTEIFVEQLLGQLNPADYCAWVMDVQCGVANGEGADVDRINVIAGTGQESDIPFLNNTIYDWVQPLFYYNDTDGHYYPSESWDGGLDRDVFLPVWKMNRPILLPYPGAITTRFRTTAALAAPGFFSTALIWLGRKGTSPPGMG